MFSSSASRPSRAISRAAATLVRTSGSSRCNTTDGPQGDIVICLDQDSLDSRFPNWQAMETQVELEFLGRGIDFALGQKHWAWLLKGKTFFCTIEFGQEGILIQYFQKERGINTACAAIMGQEKRVYYNDNYRTTLNLAEILTYVNTLKETWRARHYHITENNCRGFVRILGRKMNSSFNPPHDFENFANNDENLFTKSRVIS